MANASNHAYVRALHEWLQGSDRLFRFWLNHVTVHQNQFHDTYGTLQVQAAGQTFIMQATANVNTARLIWDGDPLEIIHDNATPTNVSSFGCQVDYGTDEWRFVGRFHFDAVELQPNQILRVNSFFTDFIPVIPA